MPYATDAGLAMRSVDALRAFFSLIATGLLVTVIVVVTGQPLVATAQESHEDRCIGVINKGRDYTRTMASKEEFLRHRQNFCRESESARQSDRTASFGGSYEFLSLSSGSSHLSEEAVAARYCRDEETQMSREEDYENYISQVPREAFDAYQACIRSAENGGVIFDHDGSVLMHNELLFGVRFNASTEGELARVRATPTAGVQCSWEHLDESVEENTIVMRDSTQANLHCTRDSWDTESSVTIYRANGTARMALKWQAYDEDLNPVHPLREMYEEIVKMKLELANLQRVQKDMKLQVQSGTIVMDWNDIPNLWFPRDCEANRGIREGSVEFSEAFGSVPKVVMAVSHLDIGASANARLTASVIDVTRTRFTYNFLTWCDTKIWQAKAVWIAYGP